MLALLSIDVVNVLRELADKMEDGKILPRQVVVGDSRFEMDFDQVYHLDAAEDAEQCMVELDAKVQDLEIENQGLREDLDVASADVCALEGQVNDLEDRMRLLESEGKVG